MNASRTPRERVDTSDPRMRLIVLPQPRKWVQRCVALLVLTLLVGFTVKFGPGLATSEFRIDSAFNQFGNPVLDVAALTINGVFSPLGNIIILAGLLLFMTLVRHAPVNAFAVCSVTAVGWLSSQVFKWVIAEPRPPAGLLSHPLISGDGASFPSGHTAFAVSLAVAVYFLARGTGWAKPAFVIGLIFALLVGGSRIYLGVHYPSDVLGSVLAPATAISAFTALWNRFATTIFSHLPLLARFGPIPTSSDA
jgi:membrane-associated phospholipid phosphatase